MWAPIVNTIIGLLIILAPSHLGLNETAANNYYIVGPIVMTIAITSIWEINRSARYLNIACGFWLLISPLFITMQNEAMLPGIVAGIAIRIAIVD